MVIETAKAAYSSAYWGVVNGFQTLADPIRSARDLGLKAPFDFKLERQTTEYRAVYDNPHPLVSICIATYNRADLLRKRSLRSVLAQTYPNIEIIVVGDACTDHTAEVMAEVAEPRLKFVNLQKRGEYPEDPFLRWMVAGSAAMNHALSIAQGDFITHLDDDDEHAPERVELLLEYTRRTRAEIVYHPFRYEVAPDEWRINKASSFRFKKVTTSSIFYHRALRHIPWDLHAYRYREPGDWNRLRKFKFLGAHKLRHPGVFLSHYRERQQKGATVK
jgi:glycosyltransferase involved in cell wall biosynthesis